MDSPQAVKERERGVPIFEPNRSEIGKPDADVTVSDLSSDDVSTQSNDVKALGEDSTYRFEGWSDYNDLCNTDYSYDYKYQLVVQADGDEKVGDQNYDEILSGHKNLWHVHSYFPNKPLHDRVNSSSELIAPEEVTYDADTGSDFNETIDIEDPYPNHQQVDGDTDVSDSFQISAGVDILDPVPFLSVGVGVQYSFSPESGSSIQNGYDGAQEGNRVYWSLETPGSTPSDFPYDPENENFGVKFNAFANATSGSESIDVRSTCTYSYYKHNDSTCPAPGAPRLNVIKETDQIVAGCGVDIIEN